MTRDELYALMWSKPATEVGLLVGMTGSGLAKACRRHDVRVPPRGYWARVAVGQVVDRAPPPVDGHVETGLHMAAAAKPAQPDATAQMLRQRTSRTQAAAAPAPDDAASANECAWILEVGMRQQLRAAAGAYLDGMTDAIPSLEEVVARAATAWVDTARAAIAQAAPGAPAEVAAEALRGLCRRVDTAA